MTRLLGFWHIVLEIKATTLVRNEVRSHVNELRFGLCRIELTKLGPKIAYSCVLLLKMPRVVKLIIEHTFAAFDLTENW